MAEQMRPSSPQGAPDPARSYERSKPEAESGMGRHDNNHSTPNDQPDQVGGAVRNAHPPRQINAHETGDDKASIPLGSMPPPAEVDHSMKDEEPDGWDQTPEDIKDPRQKRHPRTEGKGGTP